MDFVTIADFPDYEISETGIVRNKITGKLRKYPKSVNPKSYLRVGFRIDGQKHSRLLHRLLAIAYKPNPLNLPCINHLDGNVQNNSLNNLTWVTHKENTRHAIETGLLVFGNINIGINNGRNKLTEKDVWYIRSLVDLGYGDRQISEFVGFISPTAVYKIRKNLLWKHLI